MKLVPPAEEGQAWKVQEAKRDWPTRYDSVAVDAASGQVIDKVEFANWPLMAKMTNWTIDAHMGILFGLVNQILLALTAIGLIAVILRGYRMWWLRCPTRARGIRFGPPAKRGALRRMPPWAAVTAVVIAVILGWYMPLFGITLAVFAPSTSLWDYVTTVDRAEPHSNPRRCRRGKNEPTRIEHRVSMHTIGRTRRDR